MRLASLLFILFSFWAPNAHSTDLAPEVAHLSESIRFKTVSLAPESPKEGQGEFIRFHAYLKTTFPEVHRHLTLEKTGLSLLYQWKGKDPKRNPIVLCAHQDVVPIDPVDLKNWTHPPFSGEVADGRVWGRGALDDKVSLMGIMEAAEALLKKGFQPEQTIYFAFGEDEEIGGKGAHRIAALLKSRGIKVEAVFDEGMVILKDPIEKIKNPVALVGIAEKGYVTLRLTVKVAGGHSSMPAKETSIGALSKAVEKLEANPFPRSLNPIIKEFLGIVAEAVPGISGFAMKHLSVFGPLIKSSLEKTAAGRAMMGTTTAVTIFRAGVKSNVIPNSAEALVNFRIAPGLTTEDVVAHVKKVIEDDRIVIDFPEGNGYNPTSVSSTQSRAYQLLRESVKKVYPNALVAPSLVVAATDSRNYSEVAENIYRFLPIELNQADLTQIHGIDERLPIDNYLKSIEAYRELMMKF